MSVDELRILPGLASASESELGALAQGARRVSLPPRATFRCTGPDADALAFVTSGLVLTTWTLRTGDRRSPGFGAPVECVNVEALAPQSGCGVAIEAVGDCELLCLEADRVRAAVRRGGTIAEATVSWAASRTNRLIDSWLRVVAADVRMRTAAMLLLLTDTSHDPLQISQAQLAGLIGTRRETLTAVLGAFREEGLIDTRYRQISILNRDALQQGATDIYPACLVGDSIA